MFYETDNRMYKEVGRIRIGGAIIKTIYALNSVYFNFIFHCLGVWYKHP